MNLRELADIIQHRFRTVQEAAAWMREQAVAEPLPGHYANCQSRWVRESDGQRKPCDCGASSPEPVCPRGHSRADCDCEDPREVGYPEPVASAETTVNPSGRSASPPPASPEIAHRHSLNRPAYEKLIEEDLAWLAKQPRTLERDHVEVIVRASPEREYGASPEAAKLRDIVDEAVRCSNSPLYRLSDKLLLMLSAFVLSAKACAANPEKKP